MKASITIANFNNAKYLEDCLNSCINQTYRNIEILVIDDCSTDHSVTILKKYAEQYSYIKFFINNTNKGIAFNKKELFLKAEGEIIFILDSDDYLDKTAVEKCVNKHLEFPDSSIVYTSTVYFNKKGVIENIYRKTQKQNNDKSIYEENNVSHLVSFKKSLYLKTPGVNTHLRIAEDLDLYYILQSVGNIQFIDEPLYYHRIHEGSISQVQNNKNQAELNSFWVLYAKVYRKNEENLPISDDVMQFINWYKYDISIYNKWKLLKIAIMNLFR